MNRFLYMKNKIWRTVYESLVNTHGIDKTADVLIEKARLLTLI